MGKGRKADKKRDKRDRRRAKRAERARASDVNLVITLRVDGDRGVVTPVVEAAAAPAMPTVGPAPVLALAPTALPEPVAPVAAVEVAAAAVPDPVEIPPVEPAPVERAAAVGALAALAAQNEAAADPDRAMFHAAAPAVPTGEDVTQQVRAVVAEMLADVVYIVQVLPSFELIEVTASRDQLARTGKLHITDFAGAFGSVDDRDIEILTDVLERAATAADDESFDFTLRVRDLSGRLRWTEHRARVMDVDGGRRLLAGAMRDVTEVHEAARVLNAERDHYRLVAENHQDIVFRGDAHNRLSWVSPSMASVLGWSEEEILGRSIADIVHPDDIETGYRLQQHLLATGDEKAEGEARFLSSTGEWRWMRVTGRIVVAEDGSLTGTVCELRDIQSEIDARAETEREVDLDALTGLAKRGIIMRRIQESLDAHDDRPVALLCASVDGLVAVNETYTHTAGDRVLSEVAGRLAAAVGPRGELGRIAGGEFLVLLSDVSDADTAGIWAQQLLDASHGPVAIGSHEIDVTVSIGVALAAGGEATELVRDATAAMRQAAAKGTNRWVFLDPERANAARQSLVIQSAVRQAMVDDEIRPWYQPVVRLLDGALVGFEALVRWESRSGVLEPADFVGAAERGSLITTIDRLVLRQSLNELAQVEPHLTLATNVGAATLADPGFLDYVVEELERTGIAPNRLNLEVTETALVDVSPALRKGMENLAALGVTWWVDDFGTGYSSISHLRDLPVGGLKLDRSFTLGVAAGDHKSIRVAQGLAGLARGLSLGTIVEGIQGERDAAILLAQGWHAAQGYFFSRAEPQMKWEPEDHHRG